jgi:signal peptidase I
MEWLFFGLIALGLVGVFYSIISFPLFMILILLLTGLIWLVDYLFFQKKRLAGSADPVAVEYAKSFFPVILLVFLIRSFVAEPFKIPSGSMMPTLLAGDYILVNKYTYGLRVPLINNVFYEVNQPKRGDVIVFHFPPEPKVDYIKRIVGLPGDKVQYKDKRLTINGKELLVDEIGNYDYAKEGANIVSAHHMQEQLGEVKHSILIEDGYNYYYPGSLGDRLMNGEVITVPSGHYYAMGDNRDNSSDSRVWGFVPDKNLVGRAFFIWFNFDKFGRIGSSIH